MENLESSYRSTYYDASIKNVKTMPSLLLVSLPHVSKAKRKLIFWSPIIEIGERVSVPQDKIYICPFFIQILFFFIFVK